MIRRRRRGAPEPRGRATREARRRSPLVLAVWAALAAVVLGGLLLLLVLPTRTWVDQRGELDEAQRALDALDAENAALEQRVLALQTPAEIERVAREQYGLVKPDEKVFAVLPAPPPPASDAWPYQLVQQILAARRAAGAG